MPPYSSGTFMPSAPIALRPSTTRSGMRAASSISSGSTCSTRNARSCARNASPFSTAAGSSLGWGWMRSSRRLPRKSSLPKLGFSQPCSRALSATCLASFSLIWLATLTPCQRGWNEITPHRGIAHRVGRLEREPHPRRPHAARQQVRPSPRHGTRRRRPAPARAARPRAAADRAGAHRRARRRPCRRALAQDGPRHRRPVPAHRGPARSPARPRLGSGGGQPRAVSARADAGRGAARCASTLGCVSLSHLQRLEAESIHIIREVAAEAENPVMLYSIGKDSGVMLHVAMKAFHPGKPPFPLLHVDTTWKFREMYAFRDRMAAALGLELIVHVNQDGLQRGMNPFDPGPQVHTDVMKTQGLKQALDQHGFDAAFGGARRDEEKSRAKERVFSFRSAQHRWDPKNQRPELWHLYNARKRRGESIRVFPLSNWTELDVWEYIALEGIPVVPLYFAADRPVVRRDGTLLMVDDDRMPLNGARPELRRVRFRTLGDYPLTGAVESSAATVEEIVEEMRASRTSEREGRVIDHDAAASMERKKQEGYF